MASTNANLRKPVFTKVDQLTPGSSGHNLVVKVLSAQLVLEKGRPDAPIRQMRIAECLVGDETGTILFTARNDQGNHCFKPHLFESLQLDFCMYNRRHFT